MNQGVIISGVGHAGLILWLLVGGWFSAPDTLPEVAVTQVSLLSAAEFNALVTTAPPPPPAVAPTKPKPKPTPAPTPAPPPEPAPDPVPQPPAAPDPVAPPAAVAQPIPVPPSPVAPQPHPVDRVAPVPAEAPPPAAIEAPDPTPAVTPSSTPAAPAVVEPAPAAAPPEATTQIVTEATATQTDAPQLAPTTSLRPMPRQAPTAVTAPPDTGASAATDAAVAAALADATANPTASPATSAPSGPPMTAGEKDALRLAVQQCWNVGALSSEALQVTVTVGVTVAQSGVPDAGSVHMIGFQGGSEAAALQAYEAARRAILRCGAKGFQLPQDKYDQWREIEMEFNPNKMRIK